MNPYQTEHTRRWCRGRRGEPPSPARQEWEAIKAAVARDARAQRRALAARRRSRPGCPVIRLRCETDQQLAELHRNRKRWEAACN